MKLLYYTALTLHSVVDCGSPPPGINVFPVAPIRTIYQVTVLYTCDSGYEVSNGVTTATATCETTGDWEPLPTCTSMVQGICYFTILSTTYTVVDCGEPLTIPNGSPETPTITTFGGTVYYTCNVRFLISGSATVTCEASGSWSKRPTCSGEWLCMK